MKFTMAFTGFMILACVSSAQNSVGDFPYHQDIGNPKIKGSAKYDGQKQVYMLSGAGYNIWFNRDEFQYAYRKIAGDFIATANFEFAGGVEGNHRKTGWMLRESADSEAAHISAVKHGDGLIALQWRTLRGAYMRDPQDEIFSTKKGAATIQMERSGKKVIMRMAHTGEPLQEVGFYDMPEMPDSVLIGLFVCSHDSTKSETARIWNVRIDKPLQNAYEPNPNAVARKADNTVLGSRLETMQVFTSERKVIHQSPGTFEAPNWMPDGKRLLYNENGSLYTISTEGGKPEKLNTGSVNRNNNDHGISFNGKSLAISSSRPGLDGGGSTIYILPLTGGEPQLLTPKTPSYWHGWNPNNKEVVYVAWRNNSKIFNLYKMSINDRKEIQLTKNTKGHVDGPEYSPDGKYIYYNANPTGTMQLWRMKPNGEQKEQLTFDEYHSWFPHISPDGKWIAFISFMPDIDPDSHPAYKRVMLRLMPVAGGAPKVIAYLYGGQGTLNAPSWSPDSKKIAFVSYSEKKE